MKKSRRFTIRIDERTFMIVDELAGRLKVKRSKIICALLKKSVWELIDNEGNLRIKQDEKPI